MKTTFLTKRGFELAGMSVADLYQEHVASFDGSDYELRAGMDGEDFVVNFLSDGIIDRYTEGELRSLLVSNLLELYINNMDPSELDAEVDIDEIL